MSHLRFSKAIVFAVLAVAMILPASAAAHTHFGVGVGFGYYGGPFYPYGYGGPWGYPYYGPYGYAPYGYGRPMGEVHIKSPSSNAQIYINGAFAGRARDLKNIYLAPGTYNVEQRIGGDVQKEHIYVLANRSLTIEFDKPGITHIPDSAPNPGPDAVPQPPPVAPTPPEASAPPSPPPAPAPEAPRQ